MSLRSVRFAVDGKPEPKGSARAVKSKSTGRPVLLMGGDKASARRLKSWATAIGWAARAAWTGPAIAGPVYLSAHFIVPGKATRPPDLDKLQRTVLDALTGIVYVDDAQVVAVEASKDSAAEATRPIGVTIEIEWDA